MARIKISRNERIRRYFKIFNRKKTLFEKNLNSNNFDKYSGPLHIVSFIPKGMNVKESDCWTQKKGLNSCKIILWYRDQSIKINIFESCARQL